VVRHVADRVAVMYLGRVAELGEHHQVYDLPAHPYTQAAYTSACHPDRMLAQVLIEPGPRTDLGLVLLLDLALQEFFIRHPDHRHQPIAGCYAKSLT
jgi:hypothetical protein